ncbi:hypothetical protein [Modicisalibacter xianhensis]|uniref:Uncharacterized protein n=1 Tax=Modicisalibacter xianhensis TaxID=442341 RepID=A0A1I3GAW3_9GAMM|nr:hypothetical protein [Halomonas xianhensis]SFI20554.1 hypothetical protein SAMN04487959_1295 [Halomonas xianhensis]
MQSKSTTTGPLTAAELAAMMAILEEFRDYPLSPVALALAARLARLEAQQ